MRAIVVGSGAGGATVARELVKNGIEVIILEAGMPFQPFTRRFAWANPLRQFGLLGNEKLITRFFPHLQTFRSSKDLVLIWGSTTGGSTVLSCGNMVRAERCFNSLGIDLTPEFEELEECLDVKPLPYEKWRPITQRMFEIALQMGLNPQPTPKAIDEEKCISCGLCELGCAEGAKWDSRLFLNDFLYNGGKILHSSKVLRLIFEGRHVKGVEFIQGKSKKRMKSDIVILSAGGIGTAKILLNSGIPIHNGLWADIVLTIGGQFEGAKQLKETPMAWYVKKEYYMISPYPDILSHWFHKPWRKVSIDKRVGMMIKLADTAIGSVSVDGNIQKALTEEDQEHLSEGVNLVREIMESSGVYGPFIGGMLNGGHLGGTFPLKRSDIDSMHSSSLPDELWIADLSLIPCSQGLPTILTTAALALRIARKILKRFKNTTSKK